MEQRQDNDNQAQKLDLNDIQKQKLLSLYNNFKVFQRIFASWFPESHVMDNRIVDINYLIYIMKEAVRFAQQVFNVVNNVNIQIPGEGEYDQYTNDILNQAMNELNNDNIGKVQLQYYKLQNEFDNLFNSENQDPEMQIKMIKQFCMKFQAVTNGYGIQQRQQQNQYIPQQQQNQYIQQQQQNLYNYPKEESQIKHQIQQQQQNLYIQQQQQQKPNLYIQQIQQQKPNPYIQQQQQKEQEPKKQNGKKNGCRIRCQIF